MARRRAIAALALGAGLLGLVGRGPVFVAPSASGAAARSAVQHTQMNAVVDQSGLMPGGPLVAYSDALTEAAARKGESVLVTKDIMKIKALFKDDAFLDEMLFVQNDYTKNLVQKASAMVELMQPLESTVMPKFVTFLAKKRRLQALKPLTHEYMDTIYEIQQIMPVKVASATPLSEEQKEAIKEKMKAKTGAANIKLVCSVDATLLAGLQISWNFMDAQNMDTPTQSMDLSMKSYLEGAALDQGVVTEV